MNKQLISIIIPLLNEEEVFLELISRINQFHFNIKVYYNIEVLFIDDGSTDNTWRMVREAADRFEFIKGFSLSRNFGHQAALTCGHMNACGDAVITMDADLQDPPELLNQMIYEWQNGADIVLAQRTGRDNESWFKRFTAHVFYRMLSFLTPVKIPVDVGDFRLLSKHTNNVLKTLPERSKYLRGLVGWIGFKIKIVTYHRQSRAAGTTKFHFFKMLKFSFDGIFSMSSRPLKLSYIFSLIASTPFILYLIGNFLAWKWYGIKMVQGWSSILMAIVVFGSLTMIMLGVIGEYIARIYEDTKKRPQFIIAETVGQELNETN